VSKIQLFLLSLIGAGPAGFLTYLLCMYLIDQPTGANSMVMIFAILTVLCTAPLALMPILILAMYYSNYDPPKVPKAAKKKADEEGDEDDVLDEDEDPKGKGKANKSKSNKKASDDEFVEETDEIDDIVEDEDE
jgi:hypothetical protein